VNTSPIQQQQLRSSISHAVSLTVIQLYIVSPHAADKISTGSARHAVHYSRASVVSSRYVAKITFAST